MARVYHYVKRIDVWSSRDHPENLDVPVHRDLTARFQELLSPEGANRYKWTMLPLAEQLGVTLQYATARTSGYGCTNSFAKIMSIRSDPMRPSGYSVGDYHQIKGAIMVIRDDGHVLQPEDIEALAEFVGTELPNIEYSASAGAGSWDEDQKVADLGTHWQAVANKKAFEIWWFQWRDKKVADGDVDYDNNNNYRNLRCPIISAERKSEPEPELEPEREREGQSGSRSARNSKESEIVADWKEKLKTKSCRVM